MLNFTPPLSPSPCWFGITWAYAQVTLSTLVRIKVRVGVRITHESVISTASGRSRVVSRACHAFNRPWPSCWPRKAHGTLTRYLRAYCGLLVHGHWADNHPWIFYRVQYVFHFILLCQTPWILLALSQLSYIWDWLKQRGPLLSNRF